MVGLLKKRLPGRLTCNTLGCQGHHHTVHVPPSWRKGKGKGRGREEGEERKGKGKGVRGKGMRGKEKGKRGRGRGKRPAGNILRPLYILRLHPARLN